MDIFVATTLARSTCTSVLCFMMTDRVRDEGHLGSEEQSFTIVNDFLPATYGMVWDINVNENDHYRYCCLNGY